MRDREVNVGVLQRALARERLSRHSAEQLLETKSSELFESNKQLLEAHEALENKVAERTIDLRDARDNAVRLMEERTVFLARISHELRTPLNAILGIVQLMLQEESRGVQKRKLETVNASSMVLLSMINEILDFTKIEAGEGAIENVPTDISAIVDNAVDMLAQTAADKEVSLFVQKRAGLPQRVITDPSRVTQIVLNLLGNAIKFTNEGSITVNLDVIERGEPELVVSVKDTGVGVHPDRIENIFLPFTQSQEGLQVHSGGTGLGLSIVQRSAQLLGGDVVVESVLGEGSTFIARLPVAHVLADSDDSLGEVLHGAKDQSDALRSEAEENSAELARYKGLALTRPLRILVADDNGVNRSVIDMQLSYLGYQADQVANGEEVVRAVLEHNYDVVLMDISMPVMDGEEATKAIRNMNDRPQPSVVAVTASAMAGDRERYLASGMDHYLAKPVDSLALAELLANIADNRSEDSGRPDSRVTIANATYHAGGDLIDVGAMQKRLGELFEPMLLSVSPVFLAELPSRLDRLHEAWNASRADELAAILHALKGSAASAGGTQLAVLCGEGETLARNGEVIDKSVVEGLISCARATAVALQNIIDSLPS